MTPEDFIAKIKIDPIEVILDEVLLSDDAMHVTVGQRDFIKKTLSERFGVSLEQIDLIIVGSAKLGFSISEKKQKGFPALPRYRLFSPNSDVDIAIISKPIFEIMWNELSIYSFGMPYYPWVSNKFGDYLVCGWMRPDHFPKHVRLRKCDEWWDTFRFLSSRNILGRRRIRAGLFYNMEQLKTYQSKALIDCINFEKLK
ncbi:hypothetical protein [Flavihumibacter sp. UBA7668]|uniref:hypothetical protein n=1 Tax=Flavihumibacter sp. UBA7668 TaxID=1946542 RepID=UPI0025C3B51B|nr:hypothetical protein [Flavihumibacter sp. UBA7668]